jgi:large subunit ribosomal protein L29
VATAKELRALSDGELVERLDEAKDEFLKLRFQHATGALENSSRLGQARREVARVNTVLRLRSLAAAEAKGS